MTRVAPQPASLQNLVASSIAQPENRLLAALSLDEYERLSPTLELVRLPKNRILYEAGEGIHYGYFPTHGMVSLFAITEDG